jgi:hypothetical protein
MWNELYALVTEVTYFNPYRREQRSMDELVQRLENFASCGEDTVRMWYFRFPNLSTEDTDLFLVFINALLHSALTVAHCIRQSDSQRTVTELQDCLSAIRDGIRTIAHHPIVSVLQHSTDLLDGELSSQRECCTKSEIEAELASLKRAADSFRKDERQYNKMLPSVQGQEVEQFRDECRRILDSSRAQHGKRLEEVEDLTCLKDLLSRISHEKTIKGLTVPYSHDFMRHLRDWMAFELLCQDLEKMANE